MFMHKISKSSLGLLLTGSICLLPLTMSGTIYVSFVAGEDPIIFGDYLFADSNNIPLPAGSEIWIGHVADPGAMASAQDNFPSALTQFAFFGGSITEPAGTIWEEDLDADPIVYAGGGAAAAEDDLEPWNGKQIYVMITKTTDNLPLAANFSNLDQYGVFSSDLFDPDYSWIFPTVDAGVTDIFSNLINIAVIGGDVPIGIGYLTLIEPTIVPEPSTYAAVLGALTLALVALRRRRKA